MPSRCPRTDGRLVLLSAVDAGVTVGAGMLFMLRHDNTHLAEGEVFVHPDHRRRGIGRTLLAELERLAMADGRTVMIGAAFAPIDAESPGSLFAAEMGYPVASAEHTKVLDLKEAPAHWPEPSTPRSRPHSATTGWWCSRSESPTSTSTTSAALLSVFIGEIPTGDLELEDSQLDAAAAARQRATRCGHRAAPG